MTYFFNDRTSSREEISKQKEIILILRAFMDDGTIVYLGLNDWMEVIWLFSKYGSNQTRDFYRAVLIEA